MTTEDMLQRWNLKDKEVAVFKFDVPLNPDVCRLTGRLKHFWLKNIKFYEFVREGEFMVVVNSLDWYEFCGDMVSLARTLTDNPPKFLGAKFETMALRQL